MNFLKNKKGAEGSEKSMALIITLIVGVALLIFALFWFSGLGNKIIEIGKSFLK